MLQEHRYSYDDDDDDGGGGGGDDDDVHHRSLTTINIYAYIESASNPPVHPSTPPSIKQSKTREALRRGRSTRY